jgi:hypothetical protein
MVLLRRFLCGEADTGADEDGECVLKVFGDGGKDAIVKWATRTASL